MKRELFEELKQSLREANLIKRGQIEAGRVFRVNLESDNLTATDLRKDTVAAARTAPVPPMNEKVSKSKAS